MRAARGGDRRGIGGRPHLVLLRGGLDRAAPEDADWKAFCARIGWLTAERPLPDDYEEQLLGRILAGDGGADRERTSGGVLVGGDPQTPATGVHDGVAGAADRWQSRARRASLAATVLVAAMLCAAALMMFWRARPSVTVVACPDVEVTPPAIPETPVDDRAAPPSPPERRSRPLRTKDAPTLPSPSDTKPPRPPPGALARRWQHDDPRPRTAWRAVTMGAGSHAFASLRGGDPALSRGLRDTVDLHAAAPGMGLSGMGLRPRASVMTGAPGGAAIPHALAETDGREAWAQPASFARGVQPVSATWSLSPDSSRWYGVGLPPSSATAGLPSGVGVMGQIDVVKAIQRL